MFIKTRKKANVSEFIPKNPGKYVGRYPILVRSSWERLFMQWLDVNEGVKEWSSENIQIHYHDPVQMKTRRYYPDFFMKNQDNTRFLIEIKPSRDTFVPKKRGNMTLHQKVIREQVYLTNQAKFRAAEDYCRKAGMEFCILTEKELFGK